jgi:F-type H+-transporting ATPase subunit a
MPDHQTWFNYFIPHDSWLAQFREALGVSFLNGTPISMQYVLGYIFVAVLLIVMVLGARRKMVNVEEALIPDEKFSLRTFFEAMIEGTINTMETVMDHKTALFFLPLIGCCAFVIFFSNLIGLVPGFLPPTSNLNTTLAMATVVFLSTHIFGVKEHGIGYFAHFFGPFRKWYALPLMLLMFGIELISHLARPASLSIRLGGNMYADHLVVGTFAVLVPILVPLPMLTLGVVVCIVQTAVFCILSTVYIGMAVMHEEH